MKIYSLTAPSFLDPLWFNQVRGGRHHGVVSHDGSQVTLNGTSMTLPGERPSPGASVQVWINHQGWFVCATDADLDAEAAESLKRSEAADREHRELLNAKRAEAEVFNARIRLPVKWKPGMKDVLSGLTESSMGTGRNRSTVEHIYLLEPLVAGRLARDAGDFLCTSASGSNGKRWSSEVTEAIDGDGHRYSPKVTCKACLTLAHRWMSNE